MEYPRKHLACGGILNFAETKIVTIIMNKKAVDKYNARAKIKQLNKDFYKCNKCGQFISVISFPSWKDYVLKGKIREEDRKQRQRKELLHDK